MMMRSIITIWIDVVATLVTKHLDLRPSCESYGPSLKHATTTPALVSFLRAISCVSMSRSWNSSPSCIFGTYAINVPVRVVTRARLSQERTGLGVVLNALRPILDDLVREG